MIMNGFLGDALLNALPFSFSQYTWIFRRAGCSNLAPRWPSRRNRAKELDRELLSIRTFSAPYDARSTVS
jgi:hypothetical protein